MNPVPNPTFIFNPNNPSVENTGVIFTIPYANPNIEIYTWSLAIIKLRISYSFLPRA